MAANMSSAFRVLMIVALILGLSVASSADIASARDAATRPAQRSETDLLAVLGMRLFADTRLSATRNISCSTCHRAQNAFTDGLPVAIGTNEQRGTRNTPSLWNVSDLPTQFWDGRRASLEEQALDPLLNPREHGMASGDALVAAIRQDASYVSEFERALDIRAEQIKPEHVAAALAAFERTLISDSSPFDRYYYDKQSSAVPAAAIRGFALFTGRARCSTCHTLDRKRAQFTDHQFHQLGISLGSVLPRLAELTERVANADARTLDRLISADADVATLGRFVVTKDPRDIGKFRTPSLRNVALTAPYMHDGSILTLEGALDAEIYYRSLEENRPLILTPAEKVDLVAFLKSLTSPNAGSLSVEK
jgi:cytochrome c peroxidase